MRHSLPTAPQFYVTAPQACPYLDGRVERKLFTALQGENAAELNDKLSQQGFRRSQNVLYRPSCQDCAACLSARINTNHFNPSRTQRRTLNKNKHLSRRALSPWATDEQYELFRRYLDSRHATGGMADMDLFEFAAMIEETPIRTRIIEYTCKDEDSSDILQAVSLSDILEDGISMVYSFFDPALQSASLGTFMILDHVEIARNMNLPYVYLGYWVSGSAKMAYKAKFSGLEVFTGGEWKLLDDSNAFTHEDHPLSVEPIAEQVSKINLPGKIDL